MVVVVAMETSTAKHKSSEMCVKAYTVSITILYFIYIQVVWYIVDYQLILYVFF